MPRSPAGRLYIAYWQQCSAHEALSCVAVLLIVLLMMSLTVSLLAMAVTGKRSCVYVWRHAPAGPLVTAACAAANDGRSQADLHPLRGPWARALTRGLRAALSRSG